MIISGLSFSFQNSNQGRAQNIQSASSNRRRSNFMKTQCFGGGMVMLLEWCVYVCVCVWMGGGVYVLRN